MDERDGSPGGAERHDVAESYGSRKEGTSESGAGQVASAQLRGGCEDSIRQVFCFFLISKTNYFYYF